MMDAIKFFKDVKRMCDQHDDTCKGCPLKNKNCYQTIKDVANPKEIVEAVKEWDSEHPIKTRQSELLKMFPNAEVNGCIQICPNYIDNNFICPKILCKQCRMDYWLAEVE